MSLTRRTLLTLAGMGTAAGLSACTIDLFGQPEPAVEETPPSEEVEEEVPEEPTIDFSEFEDLALDMGAWSYDEANDCYYQLAHPYCLTPGSEQYESLSIFVPGPYFEGTRKGQTYSCTVAQDAVVGGYTPATAPVAVPINTVAFASQECPTSYSYDGLSTYLKAGMVYVYPGLRGRSGGYESTTQEYFPGGAPWPVVDLKAAIRCLRYNASVLPCDTERIFVFGQGGAGGLAALLGTAGDADAYEPYLQAIGAAMHDLEGEGLSDAICGVAAWCPQGVFGSADAAYEWMMGQYDGEGTRAEGTWTKMLSDDLADAYGPYVNGLGLVDADGVILQLDRIENGSYAGGTYYDHLVGLVADAAGDFFGRTDFPYTVLPPSSDQRYFPGDPALMVTGTQAEAAPAEEEEAPAVRGVRQVQATVYDTVESYVTSLNGDSRWLTYNASRGMASITGLWGFARACRPASKDVSAYDLVDRSGVANQLFGTDDQPSMHFDSMVSQLLSSEQERYGAGEGWDESVVSEWRGDLVEVDSLETTVTDRVMMMDPLQFVQDARNGGVDATAAPHWRINTGLFQSETTLVSEVNLATALADCEGVSDVAFQAVWGTGFGLAERQGDAEDNLVAWIVSCCPQPEGSATSSDDADDASQDTESEDAGEETKEEDLSSQRENS